MNDLKNNLGPSQGTRMPGTGAAASLWRRFWSSLAGITNNGQRDLYNIFGYSRHLHYDLLRDRYQRQDIVKRIVEAPVQAVWDFPPTLDKDFNSAKDIEVWQDLEDRLDIFQTFARADKLLAFGRFSIIVIGAPGGLRTPVREGLKSSDILYLQPYAERDIGFGAYDDNEFSPRFGLPTIYNVNLKTRENSSFPVEIHHSRVLHVVDNPLEHNLIGIPRLEQINNLLDDILKVAGGSAELFWILANRGMQVDVDKEMELTPADSKDLQDELDEYTNELRRYIRTRGVKVTPLGSNVADPTGTFRVLIGLLASATGIPQRILMGSEAGQLASEQDRANWAETVDKRRTNFANPSILKPFARKMQEYGVLGKKMPKFKWGDAFHQNPLERAQTMAQFARAAVNLSRQAQFGNPITSVEESRTSMGLDPQMSAGDTKFEIQKPEEKAPFGGGGGEGKGGQSAGNGNKSLPGKGAGGSSEKAGGKE